MARIQFETYEGVRVSVSPDDVVTVANFEHFAHPEAGYAGKQNAQWAKDAGYTTFDPAQDIPVDYADQSRISTRVVLQMTNGTTFVVKGTLEDVEKALFPA